MFDQLLLRLFVVISNKRNIPNSDTDQQRVNNNKIKLRTQRMISKTFAWQCEYDDVTGFNGKYFDAEVVWSLE